MASHREGREVFLHPLPWMGVTGTFLGWRMEPVLKVEWGGMVDGAQPGEGRSHGVWLKTEGLTWKEEAPQPRTEMSAWRLTSNQSEEPMEPDRLQT